MLKTRGFFLLASLGILGLSSPTAQAQPSCAVAPLETEGPYYVDLNLNRKDVTEGQAGTPLTLNITVVDGKTCQPIPGKEVEIWHANAIGNYSAILSEGTSGQTFLRGSQTTDSRGRVQFFTIYPGWYEGRAIHIHYKIHLSPSKVVTSQIYFEDAITSQVFSRAPYTTHVGDWTRLSEDRIHSSTDPKNLLVAETSLSGNDAFADITLGVSQ